MLRVLQGICLAASAVCLVGVDDLATMSGMAKPNAFMILTLWFCAAPAYTVLAIPLSDMWGAIGPGGALEALGVGMARISAKDEKMLRRVRLVLGAASGCFAIFGLLLFVMAAAQTGEIIMARLLFVVLGIQSVSYTHLTLPTILRV